jgi:hypothetical protein
VERTAVFNRLVGGDAIAVAAPVIGKKRLWKIEAFSAKPRG